MFRQPELKATIKVISVKKVLPSAPDQISRWLYCVVSWLSWIVVLAGMPLVLVQAYPSSSSTLSRQNWAVTPAVLSGVARFAVIGDYGLAGPNEASVATLVKSWNPDFIITTGDNNYYNGLDATIDQNIGQYYHNYIYPYTGGYGAGATVNRFFPSPGNHDWENVARNIQPYLDYFKLPGNERYYDYVQGPVHFFVLDSDPREPDGTASSSVQANWLQNQLKASAAPWKLVYFHHPPYSSGSHGSNPYTQWPFQSWGASAVLSGHDHDYERLLVNGLPYFVNGLGGASIYSFTNLPLSVTQARYDRDYGAMLVDVTTSVITFKFITRTGSLIDSYTVTGAAPLTPTDLSAITLSNSQINLTWTDNSNNETGFRLERRPGAGGSWTTLANTIAANQTTFSDTNLGAGVTYNYRLVAFNEGGNSGYSNEATATTTAVPTAPSSLNAIPASNTQIKLSWTDSADNETGFRLERKSGVLDNWTVLTPDIAANQTSYTDSGLIPGQTYYYRLQSFNSWGPSTYSNEASALTSVDFIVTNENDDGSQLDGMLSYALARASSNQQIIFDLPTSQNTINVTKVLPEVQPGVRLLANCKAGPTIIINGTGVAEAGLVIKGNVILNGVRVMHFGDTGLRASGPNNQLICSAVGK